MLLTTEEVFEVYRKRYNSLVICAVSILGSAMLAEDVVQDVAANIAELHPAFENEVHCKAYLYAAVKNQSVYKKQRYGRIPTEPIDDMGGREPRSENHEEEDFETLDWLDKVFAKEDPKILALFLRHVLYKEKIAELAEEANIKPNTLQHKFRAMKARARKHYLMMVDMIILIRMAILFWLK